LPTGATGRRCATARHRRHTRPGRSGRSARSLRASLGRTPRPRCSRRSPTAPTGCGSPAMAAEAASGSPAQAKGGPLCMARSLLCSLGRVLCMCAGLPYSDIDPNIDSLAARPPPSRVVMRRVGAFPSCVRYGVPCSALGVLLQVTFSLLLRWLDSSCGAGGRQSETSACACKSEMHAGELRRGCQGLWGCRTCAPGRVLLVAKLRPCVLGSALLADCGCEVKRRLLRAATCPTWSHVPGRGPARRAGADCFPRVLEH
jgi:hypothetical protein